MRARKIIIGLVFYIVFAMFMIMTLDFLENPTQYDTVAAYHETLEDK